MAKSDDIPVDQAFLRSDLKGTELENSFSGALSFMRRKYSRDLSGVDVAVTGVPFDCAVSNRPGCRFGPEAIRRASAQLAWGPIWPWGFDPFNVLAVVDYGDCAIDYAKSALIDEAIVDHMRPIIDAGAFPLVLGGDHYISYPLLKAQAKKHGPLAFLHFDAHRDVEVSDVRCQDHGSMFRYALEDGLIDPEKSIQIGIRTTFEGEQSHGMTILHADKVQEMSAAEVAVAVREVVGTSKTYLTFDIDCLDPAFAPGTGTPVVGGLSSHQALSILRRLVGIDFVGADLVEVSPSYDVAQITSLAAATIATEILCVHAENVKQST
ncbi:agmatinase [Tropicibacter sp. Alg240-R139]|uniref:agmatinase n=1 Tax=Tropicibacter sp. Alg240-R139 TaxID=2305991 RepID=UPI0013E0549A|nr:agmatinase [Tropicibacter sp. Alg240-R139]